VTALFEEVTAWASVGIGAAALVAGAVAFLSTGRPGLALSVLLDLLLAAGLLRLAGDPEWQALATAAAIVVLRRLIRTGLRAGAWAAPRRRVQENSAL
jgi:hypothetical protein